MHSNGELVNVLLKGSEGKITTDFTECDHEIESLKTMEKHEVKHYLGEDGFMVGETCIGRQKTMSDLRQKSDASFTMHHCRASILVCNSGVHDGCRHLFCNHCHVKQLNNNRIRRARNQTQTNCINPIIQTQRS